MADILQTGEFRAWLSGLKDRSGRGIVVRRLGRLAQGNAGDVRGVGNGISELRIAFGPGYRVYFIRRGTTLVLLLCGGDKSTQRDDIAKAKKLAAEGGETHGFDAQQV